MSSSTVVLGSINTDLVVRSERLPRPGETVLGREFFQAAGGKGANQAVAAARLSRDPVTFIGAVGDDEFGRQSMTNLTEENLHCDFIKVITGQPSGVAIIMVSEDGENCISVAPGANSCLTPEDVDAVPDEVFAEAKVFLVCLETPLPTVARALQRATEHGAFTILNPAPVVPMLTGHALLQNVDLITPNQHEAAALVEQSPAAQAGIEQLGSQLIQLGPRAAVITEGAEGASVFAERMIRIPAVDTKAIDSTAAGDAFNGALAVAIAEGRSVEAAVHFANRSAAISVSRLGAQPSLPRRHEVGE